MQQPQQHDSGPMVEYLRLPPAVTSRIFATEDGNTSGEATCAALHPRLLAVGTRSGRVWVLPDGAREPTELRRHSAAVLDVSIDASGAYVASSASDGALHVEPWLAPVSSISGPSAQQPHRRWACSYSKPVLSIAFGPEYASGAVGSRVVCVGGEEGKLQLNRRGVFDSRHLTIHAGEGPITAVRWRGTLIAWANSKAVKVVDVETYQKVTHIARPAPVEGLAAAGTERDAAKCRLSWLNEGTLLVGWGSTVMLAEVRQKDGGPAGVRFASVTHCFNFAQAVIRGVAAFDSRHLSVMTVEGSSDGTSGQVSHHICTWDGAVVSTEGIPMEAVDRCVDVVSTRAGHRSFVVGARAVLAIERRSVFDHVRWLTGRGQFEAAIALANKHGDLEDVAEKRRMCLSCVEPLLEAGEPCRAVGIVRQLGITDKDCWRECIRLFDSAGELPVLATEIPVPPKSTQLPSDIYDAVLNRLAAISPAAIRAALDRWPSHVYSAVPLMASLRRALPAHITDETGGDAKRRTVSTEELEEQRQLAREHGPLVEALASLHEAQGDRAAAARLLTRIGSDALIAFLARHLKEDEALRDSARSELGQLFDQWPEEALQLLVEHASTFSPAAVLAMLEGHGRWWQHRYMKALFSKDPAALRGHGAQLIELVAEFEPHCMSAFLGKLFAHESQRAQGESPAPGLHASIVVDDEDALALTTAALSACRRCGARDAEAMLLARRCDWPEAVEVLLKGSGDVGGAVAITASAPMQMGPDLWEKIVGAALVDSRTNSLLFACLSGLQEPLPIPGASLANIVRATPHGLQVPGLHRKLAAAIHDSENITGVHTGSLRLLQASSSSMSQKLVKVQRRGVAVKPRAQGSGPCSVSFAFKPPARRRGGTVTSPASTSPGRAVAGSDVLAGMLPRPTSTDKLVLALRAAVSGDVPFSATSAAPFFGRPSLGGPQQAPSWAAAAKAAGVAAASAAPRVRSEATIAGATATLARSF